MIAIARALREGRINARTLPRDALAGLVVGIVAIPLAMAFAIASGLKPEQGLITGILAGALVSLFGGSQVQIAGPTGAFVVVLLGIVQEHGTGGLLVATALAGGLLVALGLARMGAVIRYIPQPVIVFVGQVPDFLGLAVHGTTREVHEKVHAIAQAIGTVSWPTVLVAGVTLATILLLPRVTRRVPSPLVGMLLGTGLCLVLGFDDVATIGSRFGGIPSELPSFHVPTYDWSKLSDLIGPALTIAMLGAIESLLSAVVADGMTGDTHDANQELVGQGIANLVAPFLGGFAATGAIARTATNVRNGGRTPVAGVVHSIVLLFTMLVLAPYARHVPLASLAAILFVVAWNMSEAREVVAFLRRGTGGDRIVLLVTLGLTVFVDLVVAVEVGVVLAALLFMKHMAERTEVKPLLAAEAAPDPFHGLATHPPPGVAIYAVDGPFFFGIAHRFESTVADVDPATRVVIVRLWRVPYLDATGIHALHRAVASGRAARAPVRRPARPARPPRPLGAPRGDRARRRLADARGGPRGRPRAPGRGPPPRRDPRALTPRTHGTRPGPGASMVGPATGGTVARLASIPTPQRPPMPRVSRALLLAALPLFALATVARAEEQSTVKADDRVAFARDQVYPALVNIKVVSKAFSGGRVERFPSAGSGVIVSPAGHVLTNYHVAGESAHLVCILPSQEAIEAAVVAHDPLTDLSVLRLKLETRKDKNLPVPFARIGDSDRLAVGEQVLAMGNPLTLSSSMTLGIVGNPSRVFTSFTGSDMDDMDLGEGQVTGLFTRWIQHDALILPGNSGGPLVNLRGEVIGINELGGSGVGFAIPSNLASHVLNQALTFGEVRRGWFGITLYPVEKMDRKDGALVSAVQPSGPAEKAGLVPGDVVLSVEGRPLTAMHFEDVPTLYKRLADYTVGSKVRVRYLRGGEEKDTVLEVVRMERYLGDEHELRPLGLSVREITGPMALLRRWPSRDGVLVTGVRPGFPADDAKPGLQPGDVVLELDGKPVTDFASFQAIVDGLGKKAGIRVRMRRNNDDLVTVLDTSKKPPESLGAELPKAWLGVATQVVTPDVAAALGAKDLRGFRVTQVYPGTEAAKAGIAVGDVLTSLNGQELKASRIQDAEVLKRRIENMSVGEKAEFQVVRGGQPTTVAVTLEETPNTVAEAKTAKDDDLEFKVRSIVFFDRIENRWPLDQKGVVVTDVTRGGWASLAGLQGGDLILRIQETPVDDIPGFEALTKKLKEQKPETVSIFVRRGYRTHYVFVQPQWKETK